MSEAQGSSGDYERQRGETGDEHSQFQVSGSFLKEPNEQWTQGLPQRYKHHYEGKCYQDLRCYVILHNFIFLQKRVFEKIYREHSQPC